MLRVYLTRLDMNRHRFEAIRPDGSRESLELETRSLLLHDLVHFALESVAGLDQGFYGTLLRGGDYHATADIWADEAGRIEKIVAWLQGGLSGEQEPESLVAAAQARFAEVGEVEPDWLTPEIVARTLECLRRLRGAWRATPFGATLALEFPARGEATSRSPA